MTTVPVRIGGVSGVKAYASLLEYLKSLSLVRSIAVDELAQEVVGLRLTIRGDLDLLRRIASLETRLRPPPPDAASGPEALDFLYEP
jgi:hypothetical protein